MRSTTEMRAWAAGLFEGEGSLSVARTPLGRPKPRLAINMTDRDVLQQFVDVVGVGCVRGPYERPGKPMYAWGAGGFALVHRLYAMFGPYLGARRRARFVEVLAQEPAPDDRGGHFMRDKTHCKNGHPLSGPNLYVRPDRGTRECRACRGYGPVSERRRSNV